MALTGAMISCEGDSAQRPESPTERPAWLLPDYHEAAADGIVVDSAGGRIWKDGGPDIYEISLMSSDRARVYAEENPQASLTVVQSSTMGEVVVALDEAQDVMVVSVDHHAHFIADNVRSRKDVVEVALIATSAAAVTKRPAK
jgi:hypothetical protein